MTPFQLAQAQKRAIGMCVTPKCSNPAKVRLCPACTEVRRQYEASLRAKHRAIKFDFKTSYQFKRKRKRK